MAITTAQAGHLAHQPRPDWQGLYQAPVGAQLHSTATRDSFTKVFAYRWRNDATGHTWQADDLLRGYLNDGLVWRRDALPDVRSR